MKKYSLVSIISLAFAFSTIQFVLGQVQVNTSNYLKSPNVSTLEKFGNVPVSLYTGVPEISIPIYEIQSKEISIPISLSYHAGGIRVEQEASMVGLGWDLSCGGVIYRTVRGLDDLYYGNTTSASYLDPTVVDFATYDQPKSFYYNSTKTISTVRKGVINFTNYLNDIPNLIDFQPDDFSYSLPTSSGKFIIDRNGNALQQVVDNSKIELIRDNTNYLKSKWRITTGDGFRYYFDAQDVVRTSSGTTKDYISAWHLTSVKSPGGDSVTFNYVVDNYNDVENVSNYYEQKEDMAWNTSESTLPDVLSYSCNKLFEGFQKLSATSLNQQRLTSIDFANGRLRFDYQDRIDKIGEQALTSIRLVYKDETPIQNFKFNYTYFLENTGGTIPGFLVSNDLSRKRLKLVSFEKGLGIEKITHSFEYDEKLLPPKYSFARDHWGFYNGHNNNSTLIAEYTGPVKASSFDSSPIYVTYEGANRNPNEEFNQSYILKKINYPTGGYSEFEYETNDYDIKKSGNYLKYEWNNGKLQYYRSGEGNQVKKIYFTVPESSEEAKDVFLSFDVLKDGGDPKDSKYLTGYFKLYNSASNFIWANESLSKIEDYVLLYPQAMHATLEKQYLLPAGDYTIEIYLDKNIDWIRILTLNYKWLMDPELYAKQKVTELGGGLRVKKMVNYDGENHSYVEKNFLYGDFRNGKYHSYGRAMSVPAYEDIMNTWGTLAVTGGSSQTSAEIYCRHFIRSASSNYDLFSGGGISVGYDTVITVYGKDGKKNGRTFSQFHNVSDIRAVYNADSHPGGVKNFVDPLNGQLVRQAELKYIEAIQEFDTVASTHNYYSIVSQACWGMYARKYATLINGSALYGSLQESSWDCFFYPTHYSSWIKLDAIKESSHAGDYILSKTTKNKYVFGSNFLVKEQSAFSSNGDEKIIEYIYPTDFLNDYPSDSKALMASKLNFKNAPLEIITRSKRQSEDLIVSAIMNEYSYDETNNRPKVFFSSKRKLLVEGKINRSDFMSLKQSNIIDNRYIQDEVFIQDYNQNILKEHVNSQGIPTSFIWGYENAYPIAQCVNCHYNEFYFSSFEQDGKLQQTGLSAHSGNRYYDGDFNFNFQKPNSKLYFYSYWYRLNDEWIFSGILNYTSPVILSAGDAIDDVRLYPSNSQLSTFCFEPLKGLSSSTDLNNQTHYFEYDTFLRLSVIRDNDRNIMKEFKYNFRK
jgi:hypothetical protein